MINKTVEIFTLDSVAEWLRRLIRNQLGSARISSNLVAVVFKTKRDKYCFFVEIELQHCKFLNC